MHKSLRTDPGTLLELRVCHSSLMKTRAWSWVCVKSWESTWPASEAQFGPVPWPALFPDLKQVTWSLWVSFFPSNVKMLMSIPNTSSIMRKRTRLHLMIHYTYGVWHMTNSLNKCLWKKVTPLAWSTCSHSHPNTNMLNYCHFFIWTFWYILENPIWNPKTGKKKISVSFVGKSPQKRSVLVSSGCRKKTKKHHRLGGVDNRNVFPQYWGPEVQDQGGSRSSCP